jgi:hypothetical protein
LQAQDDVIRNASVREIPIQVSLTLIDLFSELIGAFPEFNLRPFQGHGNAAVLRSQISVAVESISSYLSTASMAHDSGKADRERRPTNPELVFVIHGRQLVSDFHTFLRALGLKPLEWSEARRRTGKPNPYTWEIVDLALRDAGPS